MDLLRRNLSYLSLLIVAFIITPYCFAIDACLDETIGEYKKNRWVLNSLGDGLYGELVTQIEKKDDLYERLSPEIEFSINDHLDLKLRLFRSVDDNLPRPKEDAITKDDLYSIQVKNTLHLEFDAGVGKNYFFSSAVAGVELIHNSNFVDGKKLSGCEVVNNLLNTDIDKGRDVADVICEEREKGVLVKYYDRVINFASGILGSIFNKFNDSDKGRVFSDDPLAPMKLHSNLGMPLDPQVFFEDNNNIAIGDIVEHTTYYGVTPLGVGFDLYYFVKPSYSKYRRIFRTLGFKKTKGNKVSVEVKDTVLSGDTVNIFKISPKIFGLIKLYFGKWYYEDFKEESLLQRFEVDLNKSEGVAFFYKILKRSYGPSYALNKNSILIDAKDYAKGVKEFDPVYKNGDGKDHRLVLKLPGVISYERRTVTDLNEVHYQDRVYSVGEKTKRTSFKNIIDFQLGPIKVSEKKKSYECRMKIETTDTDEKSLFDNSAMNIQCRYDNYFANKSDANEVLEHLQILRNGGLDEYDQQVLESINIKETTKINMYSVLSFSKDHINKIINYSEDEMYAELSKLIFGEQAENVFATKYHKIWNRVRPRHKSRMRRGPRDYNSCSKMLYRYGIISHLDSSYDEFKGLVGRGKGIGGLSFYRCYGYFKAAEKIVSAINELKYIELSENDIRDILSSMSSLKSIGLLQSLLVRMAGGISSTDGVHFTYIVTSPGLDTSVVQTNGVKYRVTPIDIGRGIIADTKAQYFPRISELKFIGNKCQEQRLKIDFSLHYSVKNKENVFASIRLADSSLLTDESIKKYKVKLSNIPHQKGHYNLAIDLPEEISVGDSYTVYFKLVNERGQSLSKEAKTYVRAIK